jgi:hypothetical protein
LLTSWHSFEIGYIFEQSTEHYLEKSKKNYNLVEKKSEEFFVAVCAASKINKGKFSKSLGLLFFLTTYLFLLFQ